MTGKEPSLSLCLRQCKEEVDRAIANLLQDETSIPQRLKEAMGYSLEAGGKRLRPFLCFAGAGLAACPPASVMPMALALEMFHTASLIHDDLPCMDDDSLRRGKPSNHILFGEGLATLAGDSLLLWAFEIAIRGLSLSFPAERVLRALGEFARAIGPSGVCAGQVLDTDCQNRKDEPDDVWEIAALKTGSLIRASVLTGGILGGLAAEKETALYNYGTHLGTAFQVVDDLLDKTGKAEELGKTPGKDAAQGKITFVSAYGMEKAREIAMKESELAAEALSCFGEEAELLRSLAVVLSERSN
ncbi:MAG: polyprenyl synthetase family protein [Synergistales bacterium]